MLVEVIPTFVPPFAKQTLLIPWEVVCPHVPLVDKGIVKLFIFALYIWALEVHGANVMHLFQVGGYLAIIIGCEVTAFRGKVTCVSGYLVVLGLHMQLHSFLCGELFSTLSEMWTLDPVPTVGMHMIMQVIFSLCLVVTERAGEFLLSTGNRRTYWYWLRGSCSCCSAGSSRWKRDGDCNRW